MKIDKLNAIEKELCEDFQRINELALTVKEDLENGEASLAELGTYVRCCIKRINLIIKSIESLSTKTQKLEELYTSCLQFKAQLEEMKAKSGTEIDNGALTTCNAIMKTSVKNYSQYISTQDIEEAINVI